MIYMFSPLNNSNNINCSIVSIAVFTYGYILGQKQDIALFWGRGKGREMSCD